MSTRAVDLAAPGIFALVNLLELRPGNRVAVAVDGSIWFKYHQFQSRIRSTLSSLLGPRGPQGVLDHAPDGSGFGAAVIAAIAQAM
jgi:hexokinase